MTVIMDVDMVVFQSFRRRNPVFFWTQTPTEFILLKPYNDAWVRTKVLKSQDAMKDNMWAQTNLAGQSGYYVSRLSNLEIEAKLDAILDEVKKPLTVGTL